MASIYEIEKSLQEIGFTKYESKIYLTLLSSGSMSAGDLAKKIGLHRRTVYDLLDRMIEKGIVAFVVEEGVKKYLAVDAKILLEILDKKRQSLISIIPQLNLLNSSNEQESVSMFKGQSGVRRIFEQQLADKKTVYIISGPQMASNYLKFFIDYYTNRRIERRIKLKIIYFGKDEQKVPLAEVRTLPKQYISSAAINIWGDKVAIILWQDKPFAILIRSKGVARSYLKHFNFLWSMAK